MFSKTSIDHTVKESQKVSADLWHQHFVYEKSIIDKTKQLYFIVHLRALGHATCKGSSWQDLLSVCFMSRGQEFKLSERQYFSLTFSFCFEPLLSPWKIMSLISKQTFTRTKMSQQRKYTEWKETGFHQLNILKKILGLELWSKYWSTMFIKMLSYSGNCLRLIYYIRSLSNIDSVVFFS